MSELWTPLVRRAKPIDIEQIANLHAASWQNAYKGMLSAEYLSSCALPDRLRVWQERFTAENQDRYYTLLAHRDETLVGFICLVLDAGDRGSILIDNLHVRPSNKGSGIGRILMANAATWLIEERPSSCLHLFVYEENISARAFYDTLGGQAVERQLGLRDDGQNKYSLKYIWRNLACLIEAT